MNDILSELDIEELTTVLDCFNLSKGLLNFMYISSARNVCGSLLPLQPFYIVSIYKPGQEVIFIDTGYTLKKLYCTDYLSNILTLMLLKKIKPITQGNL